MAEYGSIPAEVNGTAIPALSDVAPSMTRTVNANATTDGNKITFGLPKYSASITFKTLADRGGFLRTVGAYQRVPQPFRFTYSLGGERFTLNGCICAGVSAQSDQDGTASLTLQITAEELIDENA